MHAFWEIVASNAVLVTVLAIGVALLGRVWRNPLGLHVLWVLVLVKLFTPPLITIKVPLPIHAPAAQAAQQTGDDWSVAATRAQEHSAMARNAGQSSVANTDDLRRSGNAVGGRRSLPWLTILVWIWGIGIIVFASSHAYRVVRFRWALRSALPPPAAVCRMADRIGRQFGLRRVPKIMIVQMRVSPMVWSVGGRARVILPSDLWQRLEPGGQETILAHELAHVRRRDHLVRLLELIATTLFWWHPVVWWASRELRELEERCCDAMVLETAPNAARSYATALLDTLDFLSESSTAVPLGATAAKPAVSLARRIRMLKDHRSGVVRLTFGRALLLAVAAAIPMSLALAAESPRAERPLRASPKKKESGDQSRGTFAGKLPAPPRHEPQAALQRKCVLYRLRNVPVVDVARAVNELLRGERETSSRPSELRAVVVPEPLSNSLMVSAASDDLERIGQLIQQLDVSPKMVAIQMLLARAVPLGDESARPAGEFPTASTTTRPKRVVELKPLDGLPTDASIEERLRELKKDKQVNVLSRPQIMTVDNQPAFVSVGRRVAIADGAGQGPGDRSKQKDHAEVGLQVQLTPRVASEGQVVMEIALEVYQLRPVGAGVPVKAPPAEVVHVPPEPASDTTVRALRNVTTTARTCISAAAGRTLVLGGLMSDPEAPEEELLLFLTPRIIDPEAEPPTE